MAILELAAERRSMLDRLFGLGYRQIAGNIPSFYQFVEADCRHGDA